jgi:hypothetical protein
MKKGEKELKKNRRDGWMRIPVGIVSGAVIWVWGYLIGLFFIINFICKIFSGKTIKDLSRMSETWNTHNYYFMRYMTFCTDEKPFPFESLKKEITGLED